MRLLQTNFVLLPSIVATLGYIVKVQAFTIPGPVSTTTRSTNTQLFAEKQSRSSLLNPPPPKKKSEPQSSTTTSSSTATINPPDKGGEKNDDDDEIYGAKFFGGSAIKEELFDAELEEQADKLLKLYPPKVRSKSSTTTVKDGETETEDDAEAPQLSYKRFEDPNAFSDDVARTVAQTLQSAINSALYESNDEINESHSNRNRNNIYSSALKWDTPFPKSDKSSSSTPLDELSNALDFYKRVDVAIIAAKSISNSNNNIQNMEIRWEISVIWPNTFESRVLISGTSQLSVSVDSTSTDAASFSIISQTDKLDNGGNEGKDLIRAISSQLNARFWDLYHVGMTPSAELLPRIEPKSDNGGGRKGIFSSYDIFEIPPRLVLQPTIVDSGGRDTREAQCLPNHAFTCVIKTTGPSSQRYITTSPIEVSIRRSQPSSSQSPSKSIISWNIPLPPEYISYYDELSTVVSEDDMQLGNDPTNAYVYQPRRLVATMKYGGNAQDVEVTDVRKKLYEQVVRDGFRPVLSGGDGNSSGRPQFFFLQNDAKACFTADGGLGMAVYEWRPKAAKSNEVGIELEL